MANLLLEQVDYKIEETPRGTWKRYVYPSGGCYAEFTSRATIFGLAFLHYTVGICPETGKRKTAKGFIALGRKAMGVIAIGQFAAGRSRPLLWPRPARYRGYGYRPARLRPYGPRPIWHRGARLEHETGRP